MTEYRICPDVTFTIHSGGVLASNHRARRHVWMNIPLFRHLAGDRNSEPLRAADLTVFSHAADHFADPTCLLRDWDPRDAEEFETVEGVSARLKENFILCDDDEAYRESFGKKQSILDRKRVGTFHQQLGFQLFQDRRLSAETLWDDHKLDSASGKIRGVLYKYVQDAFMERYFASMDWEGKIVLDFGCGNGMAARRLAGLGAEVIGVDPDRKRLAEARELAGDAFTPVVMDLAAPDPLAVLPEREIDFVWMSDVFLFYFYPVDVRKPMPAPQELLRRLTGKLKEGGRCAFMEPHGCFWLAPRLGDPEKPFTILTEYSERTYSVTPSLEELSEAIAGAGLVISRIYEPGPVEECRLADRAAYVFARNFPQWWVFELVKGETG